jgi:Protein of unknown function (DUF1761)
VTRAMTLDLGAINWLAVIVATLIYFALGAVWFAPQTPIGKAWVAASGYQSPTTGLASSNLFYLSPLITAFVASVATALLAAATGSDTLSDGIVLGLVIGIGYAATIVLNLAAFEFSKPRQWTWGVIDASYHVVGLLLAAIVLALWR